MHGFVIQVPTDLITHLMAASPANEAEEAFMSSVLVHMERERQGLEAAITDVKTYLMSRAEADGKPLDLVADLVAEMEASTRDLVRQAQKIAALSYLPDTEAADGPSMP